MLAVRLANLQCVKCLLAAKCNATYEHAGWSSKSSKGQNNQKLFGFIWFGCISDGAMQIDPSCVSESLFLSHVD